MTTGKPSPSFRRYADLVSQGMVIKPLIEEYLRAAKFPRVFNVVFRDEGQDRHPDGFFHPSTHPLWPERMLFYYLTRPDALVPEDIEYENRMAMVMGTAAHSFIQACMIDAGILVKPSGTCVACGREHGTRKNDCDEWGALDRDLGRRGHMDGIIKVAGWGTGHFEMKSIGERAIYGLSDHNLEWLKTKKPTYYAQTQEYLDMTGMQKSILLFTVLGFPWKLFEIEIPYDPVFVTAQRAKYRRVREAVENDTVPDPCCAPRSKQAKVCPARYVCPIGRA